MDTIQNARKVLHEAEEALRKLIEAALAEQRYKEVGEVAELADSVARLMRGVGIEGARKTPGAEPTAHSLMAEVPSAPPAIRTPKPQRKASAGSQSPTGGRDGNRLVKVGWSKKNKKEYEHRVPRDVVSTFVRHLADHAKDGQVFAVEDLMPVVDPAGEEVPAYQIYVTLAWLRDSGVLEKKGRDGYVLTQSSVVNGNIDDLWESIPTRSA
jgi:hypothetical protein